MPDADTDEAAAENSITDKYAADPTFKANNITILRQLGGLLFVLAACALAIMEGLGYNTVPPDRIFRFFIYSAVLFGVDKLIDKLPF